MKLSICIQNLGMYNEGILLFKWLELPATEEEIDAALDYIRISHTDRNGDYKEYTDEFGCPYEEMHIPDWECDVKGLEYNEWATIEYYNEIAEQMESMTEYEQDWLSAYMEVTNADFEQALNDYQNYSWFYPGQTLREVAEELADDIMKAGVHGYMSDEAKRHIEWLQRYFDYEAFERELEYDYTETSYGVIETW